MIISILKILKLEEYVRLFYQFSKWISINLVLLMESLFILITILVNWKQYLLPYPPGVLVRRVDWKSPTKRRTKKKKYHTVVNGWFSNSVMVPYAICQKCRIHPECSDEGRCPWMSKLHNLIVRIYISSKYSTSFYYTRFYYTMQ